MDELSDKGGSCGASGVGFGQADSGSSDITSSEGTRDRISGNEKAERWHVHPEPNYPTQLLSNWETCPNTAPPLQRRRTLTVTVPALAVLSTGVLWNASVVATGAPTPFQKGRRWHNGMLPLHRVEWAVLMETACCRADCSDTQMLAESEARRACSSRLANRDQHRKDHLHYECFRKAAAQFLKESIHDNASPLATSSKASCEHGKRQVRIATGL